MFQLAGLYCDVATTTYVCMCVYIEVCTYVFVFLFQYTVYMYPLYCLHGKKSMP